MGDQQPPTPLSTGQQIYMKSKSHFDMRLSSFLLSTLLDTLLGILQFSTFLRDYLSAFLRIMAPSPYFTYITSESIFEDQFQAESCKRFREIPSPSASNWSRTHLFACRVVRRPKEEPVLPVLDEFAPALSNSTDLGDQMAKYLAGPDPSHRWLAESQLVRIYGVSLGQVWASLAAFDAPASGGGADSGSDSDADDGLPRAKRVRRQTNRDGFVDSSKMNVDSSSPIGSSQHSDADPSASSVRSIGYVDPGEHGFGALAEDSTLRHVSCVVRHVLYYFPPQPADLPGRAEFRDVKLFLSVDTPGGKQLRAADDGGISYLYLGPKGRGYSTINPHGAIIEAKKRFQQIDDGRPVVSDESFAQMVGEALAARLSPGTKQDQK